MINVTESYLPDIEKYQEYLNQIWASSHVTNNGPLLKELELRLKEHLGVKHLLLVSNGTLALQLAIKALQLEGEIITTPFSYVATVSSIVWENCKPVFADISPYDFCINPSKIEAAITENTTAILATHVYGYPCETAEIKAIADRHGLKVIYDAAHAFGIETNGDSLLNQGDISTLSFHATKVFHTGEGGAVVTNDDDLAKRLAYHRNFGHEGREDFWGLGINAKVSELHAAMGLCVLPEMDKIISGRKRVTDMYNARLLSNEQIYRHSLPNDLKYNYSYYPVLFKTEAQLLNVLKALNDKEIFPRRYFYPSLDQLPYVASKNDLPISTSVSKRILCLPLYPALDNASVNLICETVIENI